MRVGRGRALPAAGRLLLVLLAAGARACTVIELSGSGFAANVNHLLWAFPVFDHGINGTLYVDNTWFQYRCKKNGGLQDFLALKPHIVPWTAEKERKGKQACARSNMPAIVALSLLCSAAWLSASAAEALPAARVHSSDSRVMKAGFTWCAGSPGSLTPACLNRCMQARRCARGCSCQT